MVQYGLTIENEKIILEKAKSKKDGVYTFRGVSYRVRDGRVTHFATNKDVLERVYGFNVMVGVCTSDTRSSVLKGIKEDYGYF